MPWRFSDSSGGMTTLSRVDSLKLRLAFRGTLPGQSIANQSKEPDRSGKQARGEGTIEQVSVYISKYATQKPQREINANNLNDDLGDSNADA
jgi:hypothetical protein